MDQNSYTHTIKDWFPIIGQLETSWPYVQWGSGAVQRAAESAAHELRELIGASQYTWSITFHVDDDDYDTKAALQIVGA
jgi:hypothetical protein